MCTKTFADFGADVIKIEPPGIGSATRRWGQCPAGSSLETSPLFLNLNTNKRSVTLDIARPAGRDLFHRLAATADLVVESFGPDVLENLELAPQRIRANNPAIVITRISAFGQTGRYRSRAASGLVVQAAGGPMNATGAADGPPHRKPGMLAHYSIGRMAAEASLAGVMAARRYKRGSMIDVSGMEALLAGADRRACYLLTAAYSGVNAPRGVRSAHRASATLNGPYQCRDGHVLLYVTTQEFWNRLVTLIADGDEAFRDRSLDKWGLQTPQEEDLFRRRMRGWFAARSKFEIMQRGEALRLPLTAVLTIPEVLGNEHFRSRGCFVPASHPVAGELEYLGPPWRMPHGWRIRRTAPLLGADTATVLAELGIDESAVSKLRAECVV